MGQIQELIDRKLKAIREAMNRAPAPITPAKVKPVKAVKIKPVRKQKEVVAKKPEKIIKPDTGRNGAPEIGFKSDKQKETVFKTIPLNLEDKIKVEVKRGMWVYAKPGHDIEAIKAKYAAKKKTAI